MTTRIYSYNPHSASAKALAEALGVKRIKHEGSRYRPRPNDIIINWGTSKFPPHLYNNSIINDPSQVAAVTNKLSFFEVVADHIDLAVPFTTSKERVQSWLSEGKIVVARTKLTGHSGEGIVILEGVGAASEALAIVEAPLYTLYVPKKDEYRVHVAKLPTLVRGFSESVIFDIQRKAKRNDVPKEEANYRIRNLAGGFIYARQELNVPECVKDVALKVFEQTGLDFGAVDIIYNERQDRAYALEVNTAPGLAGTTLEKYVEMFKEII